MRWVARERQVPLFDRLSLMRNWNDTGVIDLYAATKDVAIAKRLHDCIGRALASLIIDAGRPECAREQIATMMTLLADYRFLDGAVRWPPSRRPVTFVAGALAEDRAADRLHRAQASSRISPGRSAAPRGGSPPASRSRSSPSAHPRPPAPARVRTRRPIRAVSRRSCKKRFPAPRHSGHQSWRQRHGNARYDREV